MPASRPTCPTRWSATRAGFGQVLLNLVGNAIKFTERGEVVVAVEASRRTGEDRACLHFSVSDTGIGIPADKQRAIFEPSSQADGSTTRRYGGTGLGLTISAQLVELMGGRIWVESEPGEGSTFHFIRRLGRPPDTPSEWADLDLSPLHGLPILVVDDHPIRSPDPGRALASWRRSRPPSKAVPPRRPPSIWRGRRGGRSGSS